MNLQLSYPAGVLLAADADAAQDRRVAGLALPYGAPGRTSIGPVTVQAGAVRLPDDLRRVKLTTDHDRNRPVGWLAAADDQPAGLHLAFTVPRGIPESDAAFIMAKEHLRDGLSVELDDLTMNGSTITDARLVAVSQVAVPAFAEASITSLAASHQPEEGAPVPETQPAAVQADQPAPVPAVVTAQLGAARTPALSAAQQWQAASAAIMRNDSSALQAALSDVTTADVGATLQPQWLGELWTEDAAQRPMIDASSVRPLSGLVVQWLQWTETMRVGSWAGDKTAIPSNVPKAVLRETAPSKLAGGVDVARELVDLGSPALLAAMMAQAVNDYRMKTEAAHAASVIGAATALPDVGDALEAVMAMAAQVLSVGQVSAVFLGRQAWIDLASSGANLDFLAGGVNLATGSGTVGGLSFRPHKGLAERQILGFDRRAVTYQELSPPVQVNAVQVALGGLDQAVHGYHASIVNAPAAVALVSY